MKDYEELVDNWLSYSPKLKEKYKSFPGGSYDQGLARGMEMMLSKCAWQLHDLIKNKHPKGMAPEECLDEMVKSNQEDGFYE